MQSNGANRTAMASAVATTLVADKSGGEVAHPNVDDASLASPQEIAATRRPSDVISNLNATSIALVGNDARNIRERRNWLIYQLYARQKYIDCLSVIETQLHECEGVCEYALFVKGLLTRRNGALTESFKLFEAATLLNPQNPANRKQLAQSLLLMGQHRRAIDVFGDAEKLLAVNGAGEDWGLQHGIGMCYLHLREYPHAEAAFLKSVMIQWHECTVLQLAHVLALQGEQERAIEVLTEALQNSPDSPDLLTALGLLCIQTNRAGKGFGCFARCLAIDPSNASAVMMAASVMQENRDYAVALNKYRVAVAKMPLSAQLWSNVGMCFYATQNTYAAIACLRRAIALAPFEWRIAYNLGIVFLHMKQYTSAFHYLSASTYLNGHNAETYMYLGVCLSLMNDLENACAAYVKALSLDQNPLIRLNYAITLLNCVQLEESSRQFARFMQAWSAMDEAQREAMGHAARRAVNMLQAQFCNLEKCPKGRSGIVGKQITLAQQEEQQY